MSNKEWNIPNSRAIGSSIWTVVWPEVADSLVFKFTVIGEDLWAPKRAVLARQFKRFSNLFQC